MEVTTMIVEYVRYRVTGSTEAFEAAYARAEASLEAHADCLQWELGRCHEDPACYILRLEWTSLDGHMQGFRKSAEFGPFLAAIKPYIDQIEEMQHYVPTKVRTRSLYTALGGAETFFRIARSMHAKMGRDELLGPRFAKAIESHVPHLGMWLCEVFGGPRLYSLTLDDIGPMLRRHAGLSISEQERARFVELAVEATTEAAPGADPGALAAVAEYFEWGSKVAVDNSEPGHVPDVSAGVPTWSWTES